MPQRPPKPKALFFDWDGTLVDSFSFLENAHNHVLGLLGRAPFEKDGFKFFFGKPREQIYPAIYGEDEAYARQEFEKYVIANHHLILPMPGAKNLLKTASSLGITMGVVSNKKPSFVNAEIDNLGWRAFFTAVVGSGEAAQDKPSAAPLLLGAERAAINPETTSIWYVGDTIMDVRCANAALVPCVYLTNGERVPDEVSVEKPALILRNCEEFADFLLQYKEK